MYWTEEDKCYLRKNYKNKTIQQMADDLERTYESVYTAVVRLGINKLENGQRVQKLICGSWV